MERPVEVTFRNTEHDPEVEAVVRRAYRVRLVITAGARRPVVVSRDARDSEMHDDVRTIGRGAFKAARRQLEGMVGREIYFHGNSVLHDDFERLAIGTEVRFDEEEGDKGPQASSDTGSRRGRRRSKRGATS